MNDTDRAGDIIGGMRKLIKKTPIQRDDRLDLNEAIREVIVLTRGEAVKTVCRCICKRRNACHLFRGIGFNCNKSS